jgi:hypothetical protein
VKGDKCGNTDRGKADPDPGLSLNRRLRHAMLSFCRFGATAKTKGNQSIENPQPRDVGSREH